MPDQHPIAPITIQYNESPPGSGKSTFAWTMMAQRPGRYIYAAPHLRLVADADKAIRAFAEAAGMRGPVIRHVTSDRLQGKQRTVRHEIEVAAREMSNLQHVAILVSHEGLMSGDLSGFDGWTLFVDEIMSIAMSGTMRLTALWPWMADTYRLEAISGTGGWSEVRCTGDAVTTNDLRRDSFLSGLTDFHRLAAGRRTAFADITDWEDARSGRGVAWWSLWDIRSLRPFRDVYFLGNGLLSSLTCQLLRKWDADAVVFRPFDLPATPPRCARPAVIHYFSAEPASSHWWKTTPEGRDAIARIVGWLRDNAPEDLLWTANDELRTEMKVLGLRGRAERPMLAGLNCYSDVHWVAMIYSAKLLPAEATAMRLFQLDRALIRQSREFEALIQFAGRGSIRDPKCVEPFHLAVYDQAQAEFVAEHLRKHGLASPVEVVAEDVGITRPVRQPAKPKSPEGQVHARVLARERQRKRRLLKKRLAASVSSTSSLRE